MAKQQNSQEQRVHSPLLSFADSETTTVVKRLNKNLKTYFLKM